MGHKKARTNSIVGGQKRSTDCDTQRDTQRETQRDTAETSQRHAEKTCGFTNPLPFLLETEEANRVGSTWNRKISQKKNFFFFGHSI